MVPVRLLLRIRGQAPWKVFMIHIVPSASAFRRSTRVCLATLALVLFAATRSLALPSSEVENQEVEVSLSQANDYVDPQGDFEFTAKVEVAIPTEYLEARLRILRLSGGLMFQKTEIINDAEPGEHIFEFSRTLADLDLKEGRYAVELRVLATDAEPTVIEDRMLVIGPRSEPTDILALVRFGGAPRLDPDSRFIVDPGEDTEMLDLMSAVLELADKDPGLQIAIAIPPMILEEWDRITTGFDVVGTDGVISFADDSETSVKYAAVLESLRETLDSDNIDVVDVPYADPDLTGLQLIDGLGDLSTHLKRSYSVYSSVLGIETGPGVCVSSNGLPRAAAPILEDAGALFVIAVPCSPTTSLETTGATTIEGTGLRLLQVDTAASAMMAQPDSADMLIDHLFESTLAGIADPTILLVDLEPGATSNLEGLTSLSEHVTRIPWLRFIDTTSLTNIRPQVETELPEDLKITDLAPTGYWNEIGEARELTLALVTAAGEIDPDADATIRATLLAESRCWAGPERNWELVDRGRAFALSAVRTAQTVFDAITLQLNDVTLSGSDGKVPININNTSGKRLEVLIVSDAEFIDIAGDGVLRTTLEPADNYITLDVELETSLSDRLSIEVLAGDYIIASQEIRVSGSYLDRLVIVASVVLVLLILLLYIRRRVSGGQITLAATMETPPDDEANDET